MYIVFDIGGTKTRVGISENGEELITHEIFPTPSEYRDGIDLFQRFIDKHGIRGKIKAAAGGIAGPLTLDKKELLNSPNLPLWVRHPVQDGLSGALDAPVYLENDTALAGLGEATRGSGRDKNIVAYLNIGTGVGGVRIVNGRVDAHTIGFEPGHQIIDISSDYMDGCGTYGHLEAYVSGRGLERINHQKPEDIHDKEVFENAARILAYGVNNTIVYWSPEIVILGGSMMKLISIDLVYFYLESIFKIFPELPEIKLAIFGDTVGLYGALIYLSEKLKKS